MLIFLTFSSFVFGTVFVYHDQKFEFYFPLCRFWLMAVGGLLAYLKVKSQNRNLNNGLSFLVIASILLCAFVIDGKSLFPGWWALIPTLGSAFIILTGQ